MSNLRYFGPRHSIVRAASIACCVVLSCGAACPTKRSVSVSVLVDMSSSVPVATQQFYVTAIGDSVVATLEAGDALDVRPIDSSSEQRSEALYAIELKTQDFARKDDGFAKRDEKVRERVRAFVSGQRPKLEEALRAAFERRRAFAKQTDIVGALNGLEPVQGAGDLRGRAIVIFSDMIQESPELNLARFSDERPEEAGRLVESLQKRGRVPSLAGATVVVVGAGEGATSSAVAFRAVRAFWREFFSRAGAKLGDGDYGYRTQEGIAKAIASLRR
jgi:hypothetical protein